MKSSFEDYLKGLLSKLGLDRVAGSWEEEWLESGEVKLFAPVLVAPGARATVVFIPGTSVYALCYAELMYGLQQAGLNVVGFDPRGQGQSSGRRGDYTILEHVADARAACAYARSRFGGPVFVMGSSQGGIEAFYLAATDEPIAGVICHNLADLPDPDSLRLTRFGPGKRKERGARIENRGEGTASSKQETPKVMVLVARIMVRALQFFARIFPNLPVPISLYLDLKKEPMRVFGNAWEFIQQDPLCLRSITLRAMASIAGTPLPRPISEIKTPILELHSSGDNIFPTDYIQKIMARLTGDHEMKIFEGLPHLITIEHVPVILPVVVEWIRGRTK